MKKILVFPAIIATGIIGAHAFQSFAADTTVQSSESAQTKTQWEHRKLPVHFLSEEEKNTFLNMSEEEKQAFLQQKRQEMEQERLKQENVIDKLLAGQSLTAEEETIRQNIIQKRSEMKQQMNENKGQMKFTEERPGHSPHGEPKNPTQTTTGQ